MAVRLKGTGTGKLPQVFNHGLNGAEGTIYCVQKVQGIDFNGQPAAWKDGNPKMQWVAVVVGKSGNCLRVFFTDGGEDFTSVGQFVKCAQEAGIEDPGPEDLVGLTVRLWTPKKNADEDYLKSVKRADGTTVQKRTFEFEYVPGVDYRPNINPEWSAIYQPGLNDPFYYPGFEPGAKKAQPHVPATPQAAQDVTIYDDDIPF